MCLVSLGGQNLLSACRQRVLIKVCDYKAALIISKTMGQRRSRRLEYMSPFRSFVLSKQVGFVRLMLLF